MLEQVYALFCLEKCLYCIHFPILFTLPLNVTATQVRLQCEIPHILTKGGSVCFFFCGNETVKMDFFSCWSVWEFLLSLPFVLYLLTLYAYAIPVSVYHCVRSKKHAYNGLIFDCSSNVIRQESRQDSWIGAGTRAPVCRLWFSSFLSVSSSIFLCTLLFGLHMSAHLPHDPDVVSCPESVNSASLLMEQSSYRSLQQNSSISQKCSYNTRQHWLRRR